MEVYLITGATSGLGMAIYKRLSENDKSCLLIARDKLKLSSLVNKKNQYTYVCDLNNLSDISCIFDYCIDNNLVIKGVIHCAGISPICDYNEINADSYDSAFKVNAFSFVEICRNLFRYPKKSADCMVIALSSIAAERASSRQAIYAMSKAALNSAINSAAQEGINFGVKVNGISLGACDTPMLSNMKTSSTFKETIHRHYPLGVIEPETVADIVIDLFSEKYKNMTGSMIKIDSGFSVVH